MNIKLMKHQEESVKFLAKNPLVFDMSDPGTGKTAVEIVDFANRRRKKGKCLLVLAPRSLLISAWENDFHKFAPDMKVSVAFAANRAEAFNAVADVYVTNIDAVTWLAEKPKSFFDKFDTLVIDESTAYKHHTSKRSKAAKKISGYFKYRRLLSGTPNSNGICDLWHQMYILDDGVRLGKSYFGFRAAACTPEQVGRDRNMVKWIDRPGIEVTVSNMIRDITIRHVFEECVDIPPNHIYSVPFTLSKKHMAHYRDMEVMQVLKLKKGGKITAINAAAVHTKLLQIASGAAYNEEGEYTLVAKERYELVMDLVEQRKHSVVFFNWEHQRDELCKEAEKRGLSFAIYDGSVTSDQERADIVKNYQLGAYRVLFAHPQSAGHGLTLTKGTATIWSSPTYNLEHFRQGLKRIYRIGQTEKTETIVIVAEGTRDERAFEAMANKDVKMSDLLAEVAA